MYVKKKYLDINYVDDLLFLRFFLLFVFVLVFLGVDLIFFFEKKNKILNGCRCIKFINL